MKNIKLEIQYNGANYYGWQRQKNHITVQEKLESVLKGVLREEIEVTGCSRTDSKVHAESYICNFKSNTGIPIEKLKYALNPKLPRDIVAISAEEVEEDFHARYSCIGKKYIYRIVNTDVRPVFNIEGCYHFKYQLDIEEMKRASKAFIGTHDFSAFKSTGSSVKTSVRTIYDVDIQNHGNIITMSFSGDGFLYNMVRIIVGTLLEVGSGKKKSGDIPKIIESKKRALAGSTAPAEGLYLKEVYYK